METYHLRLIETCLRNGYHKVHNLSFESYEEVIEYLKHYCEDVHMDIEKIYSRYRSVARGTAQGVKVFYSPEPGIRIYVWIDLTKEKGLAIN